jgi:hypothetical protein
MSIWSVESSLFPKVVRAAVVTLLAALGVKAIKNSVYNEETKILLLEIADSIEYTLVVERQLLQSFSWSTELAPRTSRTGFYRRVFNS